MEDIPTKICNKCEVEKAIIEFRKDNRRQSGRISTCWECQKPNFKNWKHKKNSRKIEGVRQCIACKKEFSVTHFSSCHRTADGLNHKCKICMEIKRRDRLVIFEEYMKELFRSIKKGAKRRNIDFNITLQDIINLYRKQNGLCSLMGVSMTRDVHNRKREQRIVNKYNISVDRINSKEGYSIDNITLVCAQANAIKMDLSIERLLSISKIIVNHNKDKIESYKQE